MHACTHATAPMVVDPHCHTNLLATQEDYISLTIATYVHVKQGSKQDTQTRRPLKHERMGRHMVNVTAHCSRQLCSDVHALCKPGQAVRLMVEEKHTKRALCKSCQAQVNAHTLMACLPKQAMAVSNRQIKSKHSKDARAHAVQTLLPAMHVLI